MKLRTLAAASVAVVLVGGIALAGSLFNFPSASLTATSRNIATLPMTGLECIPGDTNNVNGQNPNQACYNQGNIKGNYVTVITTSGSTMPWNVSGNASIYKVTLQGNATIGFPTGITTGQTGSLLIVQDAAGSHTVTWPAGTSFAAAAGGANTAPTLTVTASKADLFQWYYTGTQLDVNGASSQNRTP